MSDIVPAQQADPWVGFMQRAMTDPNFDTTKLGALLEMRHREMEQQRIERAEERKRIFSQAMTAFQGEAEPVIRDAINPFLKNRYATLAKTVETAQPLLRKHRLNVRYVSADAPPGWLKLGIIVGHDCGYDDEPFWLTSQVTDAGSKGGKLPMTPIQAVSATVTVMRRQLYTNALNLVAGEIDDDGEGQRQQQHQAPRREKAWEIWIDKLQAALEPLATVEAVDELAERKTIKEAVDHLAPPWARDEALTMFADARTRCERYARTEETIPFDEPADETTEEPAAP